MSKKGLNKRIYSSKKRRNDWWVYSGNNFKDDILYRTEFHLLPSISFEHWDHDGDGVDQSIDIKFQWLFWYIMFARYYGAGYKSY